MNLTKPQPRKGNVPFRVYNDPVVHMPKQRVLTSPPPTKLEKFAGFMYATLSTLFVAGLFWIGFWLLVNDATK